MDSRRCKIKKKKKKKEKKLATCWRIIKQLTDRRDWFAMGEDGRIAPNCCSPFLFFLSFSFLPFLTDFSLSCPLLVVIVFLSAFMLYMGNRRRKGDEGMMR